MYSAPRAAIVCMVFPILIPSALCHAQAFFLGRGGHSSFIEAGSLTFDRSPRMPPPRTNESLVSKTVPA
ncbi:hypothetical protein GY45DRAFT_1332593 [Cubamyces sp. BRFM 1775]|nr:hypothetical protein GY45DRAFT_1332593 [Cubamyces sp. BRFM 1775]